MSSASYLWQPFLDDLDNTVVVLGMARGEYPKGLSFNDARTLGEIYAILKTPADVQASEGFPQSYYGKNLILIGGGKANHLSYEFQECLRDSLSFWLEDGGILDRRYQAILTPRYAEGKEKTIHHLIRDYGIITYTSNPFGRKGEKKKVLHFGGVKGYGTLAAAYALTEPRLVQQLNTLLTEAFALQSPIDETLQILVQINIVPGEPLASQVSLESMDIRTRNLEWRAQTYTPPAAPFLCEIDLDRAGRIKQFLLAGKLIPLENSDAERLVLLLAQKRKEEDTRRLPGWMDIDDLATALWGEMVEKREPENALVLREREKIVTSIREYIGRQYHLNLSVKEIQEQILDPILGEVAVPEIIKRHNRLRTRVGLLNKEVQKILNKPGFRLIESGHWGTKSYRLSIDPEHIILRQPHG